MIVLSLLLRRGSPKVIETNLEPLVRLSMQLVIYRSVSERDRRR